MGFLPASQLQSISLDRAIADDLDFSRLSWASIVPSGVLRCISIKEWTNPTNRQLETTLMILSAIRRISKIKPDDKGIVDIPWETFSSDHRSSRSIYEYLVGTGFIKPVSIQYDGKLVYWIRPTRSNEIGQCRRFRVNRSFLSGEPVLVFSAVRRRKPKITVRGDVPQKWVDTVREVEIDIVSAIKAELKAKPNDIIDHLHSLFAAHFSDRFIQVDPSGRITHSLSSISRISRPFLSHRGRKFSSVDIRNCAPLLTAAVLHMEGYFVDDQYIEDVQSGRLYERFSAFGDRESVKKLLFASVYYTRPEHFGLPSEIAIAFKGIYPKTFAGLRRLSADLVKEGNTLASLIFGVESGVMNRVVTISPSWPLYDGIYVTDPSELEKISQFIISEFSKYRITPSIKQDNHEEKQ